MKKGNLAQDLKATSAVAYDDDTCLEQMRHIIKGYVMECRQNLMTPKLKQRCQTEFEILRRQLSDSMLREYSSFEFMERLYMQEYLID